MMGYVIYLQINVLLRKLANTYREFQQNIYMMENTKTRLYNFNNGICDILVSFPSHLISVFFFFFILIYFIGLFYFKRF